MFMKRLALILMLAAAAPACAPAYYDEPVEGTIVVQSAPPPVQVETRPAPPYQGAIWVEGYWNWSGGQYVWVPGRWDRGRRGYVWVPHHYQRHGRGWRYIPGHWRRG
jgi:hypothetical protein